MERGRDVVTASRRLTHNGSDDILVADPYMEVEAMGVIAIRDQRLVTALKQVARREQISVEEAARTAVYRYVREAERAKIHAETKAFWAMYPHLLERYRGQYVAVHECKVVDSGPDIKTLYQQVRERYGDTPVLLAQVTPEPVRELVFRSPRLEPIAL